MIIQTCYRSELLLRGVEIYLPNLLLCHEQHATCYDFCDGSFMQVDLRGMILVFFTSLVFVLFLVVSRLL